ncbi:MULTISPECIES: hypothetical protein [Rhodopseudomonas]|uniref:Uncharacterized protein n=1 Tax=Rhodopseudomonas palustris TaxID=1076 RepID=A0A0D7EHQ6_RHOPL|nr:MULTISPECIES: hypothetical protein [Rhodopseudomonas]KIZ39062.1 hypothetical protein OO17_21630 [Rhodopseudomonas palustris]MDF3809289.1 hypothetical protein [Rhodopseudomonas sp. BAL398]WOK19028.1 hypothetical protein RBJ75_05780 [Rhodopseudomonas sp. BAL398]
MLIAAALLVISGGLIGVAVALDALAHPRVAVGLITFANAVTCGAVAIYRERYDDFSDFVTGAAVALLAGATLNYLTVKIGTAVAKGSNQRIVDRACGR